MSIALIADLHGNWPAVQRLSEDLDRRGIQTVYCLGDLVGKGPESDKTCDWARERCQVILGGNWDYGVAGKHFPNDAFYWDQLGPERMAFLAALPCEHHLAFAGLHLRLIHGRPLMPQLVFAHSSYEELQPWLQGFDGFIYADAHRPALRTLSGGYVINTGSVGNSLGVPRVHYLILSEQAGGVDFTCVSLPYDNQKAAEIARLTPDLPGREAYIREVTCGIYSR